MRIEMIAVGDELLDGRISDSNSTALAAHLFGRGLRLARVTVVDDDLPSIADAIREASARADCVVTSGGLGPTTDDLTAEAVAMAASEGTRLFPDVLAGIQKRFESRGMPMPDTNRRQAILPRSCRVLTNDMGTAPGFVTEVGAARVFSFAGVPAEFTHLVEKHLLPEVDTAAKRKKPLELEFRFFGISESDLAERLEPLFDDLNGVVQYRPQFPENIVRVLLEEGPSDADVEALKKAVAKAGGRAFYGHGSQGLAHRVIDALVQRGEKLAVAESCTGGLLGALITEVPGASAAFAGGVISYDNAVKEGLLGVQNDLLKRSGAVSEGVAAAMAEGARHTLRATWALSVTGIAGPDGGTEEKPVGTVCFGLCGPGVHEAKTRNFPNWGRQRIRRLSALAALRMLHRKLEDGTHAPADVVSGEA
jgi:nicotinamide-nucleotide amidase